MHAINVSRIPFAVEEGVTVAVACWYEPSRSRGAAHSSSQHFWLASQSDEDWAAVLARCHLCRLPATTALACVAWALTQTSSLLLFPHHPQAMAKMRHEFPQTCDRAQMRRATRWSSLWERQCRPRSRVGASFLGVRWKWAAELCAGSGREAKR